ncbi:MAG: hypothetical protein NTY19_30235 [Planctomycetota bacterium]|nr:hypothetical protein [Planctomycetota bacterium]
MRFNFRFQRWVEVLEVVAKQAGLSLVLESPPPGTFNYADTREYTPTEAIDLLNGVLVTKGYTLVRRERMLVLVDLSEGIPEGLIERVPLDELSNRGKFEMVTVLFPLKGRDPDTVIAEIKPLLGPNGKAIPLSLTGQLLLTDTAGIMKAISAVIDSMPVPLVTATLVPIAKIIEPPTLAVYPIKTGDPATTLKMLQAFLPSATLVLDPTTDQIHVNAGASQQAFVKTVLDQIQSNEPANKKPRLETYRVDEAVALQVVKTLATIAPDATLARDPKTGRLLAWAPPADQEKIKEFVEKMGGATASDPTRQFEIHRLSKADPAMTVVLLQELFPDAKIVLDKASGNLVAIATAADQKAIKTILEQLQLEPPGAGLRFESYLLRGLDPTSLVTNLQTLLPNAKVTLDKAAGKLVVFGTPVEHETIKAALEKLGRGTTPENTPQLVVYRLTKTDPTTLITTLQPLVPEAKLAVDPQTKNLVAVAVPADQATIKQLLEQLQPEKPGPDTLELKAYPVTTADPPSTLKTLKILYPNVQVALDGKSERFLVTANAADQTAIKASLDQIQTPTPAESKARFESYLLQGVDPTALLVNLQTLVPNAKVTLDAKAGKLVVFGTPAEHETIKGALEKLGRGTTPENTPQLVVYRLTKADPATVVATLQPLVPEAKLTVDLQTKNLVVVAVPADQATIKQLLEQLQPEKPGPDTPELKAYPVTTADPAGTLKTLKILYPNVQVALDGKSERFLVTANAADQAAIKASLDQIQAPTPAESKARFEVFPLHGADATTLVTQLQALAPNAKLTADKTGRLIVFGTPAEHEILQGALEKLGRGQGVENMPQLEVYRLTKADPTTAMATLLNVAPEAKVTLDAQSKSLIVLAVPADQKSIRAVLEQLQSDKPATDAPQLRFYPLAAAPSDGLMSVLKALALKAQITFDASSRRLTVVASPEDHTTLKTAIEQIEQTLQTEEKYKLVTYAVSPTQHKRFQAVVATLATELPGIKVMDPTDPNELVIWAKPSQHVVIAQLIEQLQRDVSNGEKYQLAAYPLKVGDPTSVLGVLKTLAPNAQITVDARTRRLIIWAPPKEQAAIQSALEKLGGPQPAGQPAAGQPAAEAAEEKLMVYPVQGIDAALAVKTLKEVLSADVRLTTDITAATILAWAMPWEHDKISEILKQLQAGAEAQNRTKLIVYPVAAGDPTAIVTVLKALVPRAQAVVDANTRSIAATALPTDHELIRTAIEQLSKNEPPELARKIVTYPFKSAGRGARIYALTLLRTMFPEVQLSVGAETDQLVVLARPNEHVAIKAAIEQLNQPDPPETARRLTLYTVEAAGPASASTAIATLTTMFPDATFTAGSETGQIIAWARPTDHQQIAKAIQDMSKKEPPEKARKVVVYVVEASGATNATGALTTLTMMFPDAKFTAGLETGQIIAWARPADHQQIAKTIEDLSKKEPPEKARKIVVYPFKATTVTAGYYTIVMLRSMFPEATFSIGAEPDKLVVLARPKDHETIKSTVEQLAQADPPETARRLTVYILESSTATTAAGALTTLTTMFPDARFTAGMESGQIIAWARPDDHTQIAQAIQDMSKKEPPEKARKITVYALEASGATSAIGAITTLTMIFPDAKFTAGLESGQIIAWARPADHTQIAKTIEDLSKKEPPEKARKIVVYPFKATSATAGYYTIAMLRSLFPDAQFSTGAEPDKLVVLARPKDHEAIKTTVEQLAAADPPETARRINVYTLESSGATSATGAIATLTTMLPEAKFSAGLESGQIIAWARPAEHLQISQAIQDMSKKEPPDKARKIIVYTFKATSTTAAYYTITMLRSLFPEAQFSVGAEPDKLVVLARPKDHEAIKTTVEQLAQADPPETARRIAIYTLESSGATNATGAITTLTTMFPDAKLTAGLEAGQIIAWARPEQHKQIAQAVQDLSQKEPPDKARKIVVYPFKAATPTAATYMLTMLRTMFPEATFSIGADPDKLVVFARPKDHEGVKSTVEQLAKPEPEETARRITVYTLESSSATSAAGALTTLTTMFPDAKFSVGLETGQIIAWARPADHQQIAKTIEDLSQKEPPEKARKIVVYTFKATSTTAAYYTITMLRSLFPEAQFSVGAEPDKLVVLARPKNHEAIKTTVEQLAQADPPETARRIALYTLESSGATNATGAIMTLTTMFPEAKLTAGLEAGQIIAWARPEEHKQIAQAVQDMSQKEPPDKARKIVVYPFKAASPTAATYMLTMLRTMFPEATFSLGAEADRLVVFARPKDHEGVKSTVEQLAQPEPEETARRITVYTLESSGATSATGAITTLTSMFTDARFSAGLEPGQIIAWARPVDHLQIAKAIEDMSQQEPPEKARKVVVYPFKATSLTAGTYILTMLRSLFPEAQFSLGSEPDKLVALARPKDHEAIRSTVEQLAAPDAPDIARKIMVYTLESAGPNGGAITTLTAMFPEAKFSAGTDPGQIIAWARPVQHEQIAKAVEEMSKREPPEKAARMASYTLEGSGAYGLTYALIVLRKAFPDAQFSVGSTPNQLFAWARPTDQEAIKKSIEELSKGSKPTAQVYRFEWADPRAAYTALATLVPNAQIALDTVSRSLVVSATPEDHAKIKATVDEMDRRDAKELPGLQVHRFKVTDPANLLPVLQGLFKLHPQVQLALDERNNAIIAMATPAQQDTIRGLVEQVEREAANDAAVILEVYALGEGDAQAALQAVTALLKKQGAKADLSIEPRSNSLVAIALPEQQQAIQAALELLKPADRTLEILQLDVVDPDTAELAIMRLFSGEAYATAPMLDADVGSQQLFVRATKQQHEQIRELLVKMGETGLLLPGSAGPRLRVFPFEGDVEGAVEEIKRIWPQLRSNPIEIVDSLPEVLIRQRTQPQDSEPAQTLERPKDEPRREGSVNPVTPAATDKPGRAGDVSPLLPGAAKPAPKATTGATEPGAGAHPATPAETAPASQAGTALKPVTIIPGDGNVTLTSEDPGALRQFETLLRAMSRHRSVVGRNYAVFLLRNAKAPEVAATLQQIFRTLPRTGADTEIRDTTTSSRYGRYGRDSRRPSAPTVVIVPEERLNAIVAYASRTDRTTIENLVKVLDTADLPESLVAQRLQIIPIENADAEDVAENLRSLFKTHLDSLSVDESTNSLIALAPPTTMKELKQVVAMLDEAAGGGSGRTLELFQLQKTNSERMQELLQPFLKSGKKPSASKRPSSSPRKKSVPKAG